MNRKQKIGLWAGIAVVVLMGIFPPYLSQLGGIPCDAGYDFLLSHQFNAEINTKRLVVQWVIVGVITGGLIATFHDKKKG